MGFKFTRGLVGTLSACMLLSLPAVAKEKTVKWEGEFCLYSAKFDDQQYTAKQVRAAWEFVMEHKGVKWQTAPMVSEPADIARADLPKFQAECENTLNEIRQLDLVDLPSVNEYRKAKLEEVSDTCRFEMTQLRGYRDPSVLRTYQPSEFMCSRYIDALEGKARLTDVWREIIDKSCKNNSDVKGCRQRFLEAGDMPDGTERIKIAVQQFGWQNCSTNHTKANTLNLDGLMEKVQAEYKRKFKLREYECNEP